MHGFRKLLLNDWLKGADTYEIQQCHQKSVQNLTFVCLAFNFVTVLLTLPCTKPLKEQSAQSNS